MGSDGGCVGVAGGGRGENVWHRPGFSLPPTWPESALELALQAKCTVDGIVHVPRVPRMSRRDLKNRLLAEGLGGLAYAVNVDKDGRAVMLGFESVGRPCLMSSLGELSLLRMALDTIVYALRRRVMEPDRTRVEARLQQARRMEKIGTLPTGIPHNFTNILAGIPGHTEALE